MTLDTDNSKNKLLGRFDEILIKHLERLIPGNYLIDKLTLNSVIISCLILMMERENEIESFPSHSSARYTSETLISELEEMGLEHDRNMNNVVQNMIEKGYIHVDDEYFVPGKQAKSMVQLLDRTFPGMPGMNFIAYFIQILDEVNSGRKDMDSAISQFDQMLNIQGVSFDKEQKNSKTTKVLKQSEEQKNQIKKSSNILGCQKVHNRHKASGVSPSAPKILSMSDYEGKFRKVDFGKSFSEGNKIDKITPETDFVESEGSETGLKTVETQQHDNIESENKEDLSTILSEQLEKTDSSVPAQVDEIADTNLPDDGSTSSIQTSMQDNKPVELNREQSIQHDVAETEESMIDKPYSTSEKNNSLNIVDSIESQIRAFEEDLALQCPLCKQSKVQAEVTSMGKTFYRCLTEHCSFISWGKPYHIPCPQCNNTFLVETSDKAGKRILKCPRSTCIYRQNLPGEAEEKKNAERIKSELHGTQKITPISKKPRKRVKKRRVVRRKK